MSVINCPFCGAKVNRDAKYCIYCGRQFPSGSVPDATSAPQAPACPPKQHSASAARETDSASRGRTPGRQRDKPYRIAAAPQPSSSVAGQGTGPCPRSARSAAPDYAGRVEPDSPTRVFGVSEESSDIDSPTYVIPTDPVAHLVRTKTDERYELVVPAVVGKGSGATVRIDGNHAISRIHIRIEEADGEFTVEDLGSTNRTALNEKRLEPGEKVFLENGDTIRLADECFEFIVEQ